MMKKRCLLILSMVFSLSMVLSFGFLRSTDVKAADPLSITQVPQSTSVNEGELAYFNVKATGTSLKYSWEYKLAGSSSWTVWTTKTTASISVAYASYRDGMSLRCTVSDGNGSKVTTTPVTLTYKKAPATIVTQPQNATVEEKNLAYFSVAAKGSGLKYQWEYMTAGSSSWVTWSSKTTASISVAYASYRDGMKLRCVVTDSSGNKVVSNTATLTYYKKLVITSQPVSTTVDQGKLAYFSVAATGTKLKCVWEYKEAGSSTWKTWNSKTTASISVAYHESRDNMKLRCVITDIIGNKVYSNEATLKYNIKYPSYIKSGSYGTVTGGNLRVRSEPSTQGSQIGLINSGTTVIVEGKVTFTSDGNVWCFAPAWNGYIAINFLDKINDPVDVSEAILNYVNSVGGTAAKEWGGGDGTQCVELPKHYIDTVFGCDCKKLGLGNGNTLYKGIANKYPDKFTLITYYDGFMPRVGDILSLNGSDRKYGHAVIVKSVDVEAKTCVILEQWKGSKTVRTKTIKIEGKDSGTNTGIIGCARPK